MTVETDFHLIILQFLHRYGVEMMRLNKQQPIFLIGHIYEASGNDHTVSPSYNPCYSLSFFDWIRTEIAVFMVLIMLVKRSFFAHFD